MAMLKKYTGMHSDSNKSRCGYPCLDANTRVSEERLIAWPFKGHGGGIMGTDA